MTEEMVSGAWAHPPDDVLYVEPSLPVPLISISLYNLIMMAPSRAVVGEDAINNNGEERGDTVKKGVREMKGWSAPKG
ncbi:hypothetical protein D8674_025556 [Pyrus ussuriensis x Pyrus communis]|uniref:Uncharacterized protein n=1 Tax=Pyrus ussuriensis x Pyrus communis TaxID=2448454 RepID=A0A5N5I976_9ROSA|nr:hypothetical protein D8674_025556 [Pyrus ussuriensis x Pyrus communis]